MNLLIVSAGKNTRFGEEKALQKINGIENIVNTINLFKDKMENVVVAIRSEMIVDYAKAINGKAYIVFVNESKGSAQGTKDALLQSPFNGTYMVTWGDMVFQNGEFLDKTIEQIKPNTLNILVENLNGIYGPYILNKKGEPMSAFHGKLSGYHLTDRGVFFAKKNILLNYLKKVEPNTKGDYRFMSVVNVMYNSGNPANLIEVKNSGIRTFNTKSELESIVQNE